ncbi:MAG: membrane protein FxsA [Aquamicrobium sp.]|nr:membrane protein FxsA [Aquamicrobium sp.]
MPTRPLPRPAGNAILPLLPLLLIALPLIEIAGFAFVGSLIGVLPTVALVIATTILGAALLRIQGIGVVGRIRAAMETGAPVDHELVHGLMIAIAGLLLVIPGFFTDIFGLALFIPPLRELVWRFLKSRIVVVGAASAGFRPRGPRTIDLDSDDFSRRDESDRRRLPPDDGA